jgi:transcriptional regulator with XRE-family HTH domain
MSFDLSRIRELRKKLNLTQFELAQMSQISLATLQNIESGRANPEYSTLNKILLSMGHRLIDQPAPLDLQKWISYGLPLMADPNVKLSAPQRLNFIRDFRLLQTEQILVTDERQLKSWLNFMIALRDHFPSIFKQNGNFDSWIKKHNKFLNPKLRRISLNKLSEFL